MSSAGIGAITRRQKRREGPRREPEMGDFYQRWFDADVHMRAGVLRQAHRLIVSSGVAELLDQWEREDREALGLRGSRGPWANSQQLLTLMQAMALRRMKLHVTEMTSILMHGMDEEGKQILMLDVDMLKGPGVYARLYRSCVEYSTSSTPTRATEVTAWPRRTSISSRAVSMRRLGPARSSDCTSCAALSF